MNYSEEGDKPQSDFNDIIVDESKSNNNPVPPLFSQGALEVQPNATISNLDSIILQSKIVKWSSLILSVCCFIYLLPNAWPLVLTFVFPIVGFVAAHKFNDCLIKFYVVYLCLALVVQIIVMGVLGGTAYIVFQCFVMLAEIAVLIYTVKLSVSVGKLNTTERLQLRSESRNG